MTDFHDLIDTDDLSFDEEERLQRTHELLLKVGPPADLPSTLLRAPSEAPSESREVAENVVPLPARASGRGVRVALLIAAAFAAAAFGGGYLFGHSNSSSAFASAHVVPMHAIAGAQDVSAVGLVKVGHIDSGGNWPLQVHVTGLPKQPTGDYYELWLTKNGKPYQSCGTFRIQGSSTTVRFTVPYTLSHFSGWVVTSVAPGGDEPGQTLMTT
jgi:Anti-sigma-K factor rskA